MGVSGLWDILKDAKTGITLKEMSGQTLAVDLAVWVCEADGVKTMHDHVQKPYLRNLFFRVTGAMKAGIKLIFVLDGKAPDLKLETISHRISARGGGGAKSTGVRRRLNARFNECCRLLDGLGVPWIKAEGEAEAFCAALNKCGLVDAVITNDGDCFLYGARTVYRNFSVDKKETLVERYLMEDIEKSLHFNQRGLIALGLLLGCDYCPKGVMGIGTVQAVKLLSNMKDRDPLDTFLSWRDKSANAPSCAAPKKSTACLSCKCKTSKRSKVNSVIACTCQCHVDERKTSQNAVEEKVKSLALKDPRFPDKNIIQEFLITKRYENQDKRTELSEDSKLKQRFSSRSPILDMTCQYLVHNLVWKLSYAVEKVLPLVTLYHLRTRSDNLLMERQNSASQIKLHSVLKQRTKDRIPCFEVRWTLLDSTGDFAAEEEIEMVTIELEEDVKLVYPGAIIEYFKNKEQEKVDKKKGRDEAKKLQKKKIKIPSQTKDSSVKVTSFFDSKKSPKAVCKTEASHSKQESGSIDELGSSLASLSLQPRNGKPGASAERMILTSAMATNGARQNMAISFKSPDGTESHLHNHDKSPSGGVTITQAPDKDITFSEQLDFSLGFFGPCLTPQRLEVNKENIHCDGIRPNRDHDRLNEKKRSPVIANRQMPGSHSPSRAVTEDRLPCTPQKPDEPPAVAADSPIFMTLMERLKLREKSTD